MARTVGWCRRPTTGPAGTPTPVAGTTTATGTAPRGPSTSSTAGEASVAPVVPPDWYPDPTGRFHWRYWTGHEWTEHVSRDQELFVDPLGD